MPRKIKDLESDLLKAGFTWIAGKGSHRKYLHSSGAKVTISGKAGDDAQRYQERQVAAALEMAKQREH